MEFKNLWAPAISKKGEIRMKKFKFTIQGNEYEVEILNFEDNIAEVDVNGSVYKVQVHKEIKTTKTPRLVRTKVEPSPIADVPKTSLLLKRKVLV